MQRLVFRGGDARRQSSALLSTALLRKYLLALPVEQGEERPLLRSLDPGAGGQESGSGCARLLS